MRALGNGKGERHRSDTRLASCALAIMAKAPRMGEVKTRLVPPLNPEEAARLNGCFLRDLASNIALVCADSAVQGFAAYTPIGQEAVFEDLLPPSFGLLLQRGAELGERLFHAFEDFFAAGFESVCLINSDSPTLPTSVLDSAVRALRAQGDRLVLGEAVDGGYYLIGLKNPHSRLFEEIAWSTGQVSSQTLQRAAEIDLRAVRLPVWYDVDDGESLRLLYAELFRCKGIQDGLLGFDAPHTRKFLREAIENGTGDRLSFLSGPHF